MPTILSTKKLTETQLQPLINTGFLVEQYNAIHIVPIDFETPRTIRNAIFTSQNTVEIVLKKEVKIAHCFCVGRKTKALLEKNGMEVIAWTEYGKNLGKLIVEKFADEQFVFFCGNRRRPELPSLLKKNEVQFEEICTYRTELNPKQFKEEFAGILFFSPSGVESFCMQNEMGNTTAFCIGTTTASEAGKHTDKIVVAEEPTIESLVRSCFAKSIDL